MQIYAFQGFRFTDAAAADPGSLAAPPFDQIDADLRDELHRRSPNHYTHFTAPVDADGQISYPSAAALHASWLASGAVQRDSEPSLYPYVIESPAGRCRPCLCCLVAVGTTSESALRPHELTVEKPLADRLALLRATRIDPEPVMILAEDDGSFESRLQTDLEGEALVSHRDRDGNWHRLYRIVDPERIRGYQELLSSRAATIADGHHRCKTAQLFAQETGAVEGTAAFAKMVVLISAASEDLEIAPIHRALGFALDLESARYLASDWRILQADRSFASSERGSAIAAAVAAAPTPALGVRLDGGETEIWRLDSGRAPDSTPRLARGLSAVLLHHMLLPALGLDLSTSSDGTVRYRSDPDELYRMVDDGEARTAFWLPPMEPAEFARAVREGDVLPPKSTRFMPKLISGLVWAGHDAELV